MDRKQFLLTTIKGAAAGVVLSCCPGRMHADTAAQEAAPTSFCDGAFLRSWLSEFVAKNESTVNRDTLVKLLEERGRACCRDLAFRQKLIEESNGSLDKLVELMGKIVGADNCQLKGNRVTLVYPVTQCVCGWSPRRAVADPNDPYCECSKSNNQYLFETVTGKKVNAKVVESPRRGGSHCKFILDIG